jgi:ubiquinone/menaquinone biosynthesis C-methylase UbiE
MAKYNPSYHENIKIIRENVDAWDIPDDAKICDLGAGTGNYIAALSRIRPNARYTHIDFDRVMNEIAREKYAALGIKEVKINEEYVQRLEYPDETFDLVLCVNALYAISPQEAVLRNVYRWLKPGGRFFVIDFGRRNRVIDWSWYLIRNLIKEHGVVECGKFVFNSVELIRQNARGSKIQEEGAYWLHSTQEFGRALADIGFQVEDLRPCYRDYCDLAICTKP